MPGNLDLNMYQGDTFSLDMSFTYDNGEPVDLTGATVRAQWRIRHNSSSFTAYTVTVTDAAQGELTLSMGPDLTAHLQKGVWDLEYEVGGVIKTLVYGVVDVRPEVTR